MSTNGRVVLRLKIGRAAKKSARPHLAPCRSCKSKKCDDGTVVSCSGCDASDSGAQHAQGKRLRRDEASSCALGKVCSGAPDVAETLRSSQPFCRIQTDTSGTRKEVLHRFVELAEDLHGEEYNSLSSYGKMRWCLNLWGSAPNDAVIIPLRGSVVTVLAKCAALLIEFDSLTVTGVLRNPLMGLAESAFTPEWIHSSYGALKALVFPESGLHAPPFTATDAGVTSDGRMPSICVRDDPVYFKSFVTSPSDAPGAYDLISMTVRTGDKLARFVVGVSPSEMVVPASIPLLRVKKGTGAMAVTVLSIASGRKVAGESRADTEAAWAIEIGRILRRINGLGLPVDESAPIARLTQCYRAKETKRQETNTPLVPTV